MEVDPDPEMRPSDSNSAGANDEQLTETDELATSNQEDTHEIQAGDGEIMKRFRPRRVCISLCPQKPNSWKPWTT